MLGEERVKPRPDLDGFVNRGIAPRNIEPGLNHKRRVLICRQNPAHCSELRVLFVGCDGGQASRNAATHIDGREAAALLRKACLAGQLRFDLTDAALLAPANADHQPVSCSAGADASQAVSASISAE